MSIKLSKEEMFDAVKEGVKEAILEMTESGDGYTGSIRTEQFMEQIRQGTFDAVWAIATNATDAPCADFYEFLKRGVKEGIETMNLADLK